MARTHGASNRFHQDDGVVLGKGGVPIDPTSPIRGIPELHPHGQPGAILEAPAPVVETPEHPAPVEFIYRCDKSTWGRNMDGWQALQLLNVIMGGELVTEITEDEFSKLPSDVRWHFKRQAKKVTEE